MFDESEKQRIIDRYTARLEAFGVDVRALNPGDLEKYRIQHMVHASVGDVRGKTILDVGCGLAHYYEFLLARGIECNYVGYDIVPRFVEENRNRFPKARFEVRDIFRDGLDCDPDFVVMCQVFNNKYAGGNNTEIVKQALAITFERAKVAVSIDMLSSHVNYRDDGLHYFNPEEMFAFAKTLTRYVSLRHEYLPFHFTLALYKAAHIPCG